jgi:hypothetical protein
MPDLSLRNIDQISNDIRNEEVTFSHLPEDLIDHICCDVEYEMQSGLDFHDAYRRVKHKMGSGRRIREIQEETLYLVDSKYRKIANPYYLKAAREFLMPSTQTRQQLNAMLADYSKYLATLPPPHDSETLNRLLEPSAYLPVEDAVEDKITMMSSFHSLEIIKNNLITVESYLLSEIAAQ